MADSELQVSQVIEPAVGLRREMELLQAVANGSQSCGFLIWRCQRAMVVPKRLSHKAGFDHASSILSAQGWPVVIRDTGGDLTPQAPGLINIAMAFRQLRVDGAIRDSYLRLCRPLNEALSGLGVSAYCDSVKGAFCDGDFNLVVAGRKLAGTAQRWRKMDADTGAASNEFAVLAHAVVLVDEDLGTLWRMGNTFYQHCGIEAHIDAQCHVQLADLIPGCGEILLQQTQQHFNFHLNRWLDRQNRFEAEKYRLGRTG